MLSLLLLLLLSHLSHKSAVKLCTLLARFNIRRCP